MSRIFSFFSHVRAVVFMGGVTLGAATATGQIAQDTVRPVTDAELQNPGPDDWLMWRRTLDSWGYSPFAVSYTHLTLPTIYTE